MKRQKLLVAICLTAALLFTGCGDDEVKENGNASQTTSGEKENDNSSSNSDSDDAIIGKDDEEGEGLLAKLLKELNPTYETNTTDVSAYYVCNENITLDKNISELEGVAGFKASVFDESFEEEVEAEYAGWDELKDKYIKNDGASIGIVFEDGTECEKVEAFEVSNLDEYHDIVGTHSTAVTFEEVEKNGKFGIENYSSNGIKDLSEHIGANIDGTKTITEQILHLKDKWGEPSIIASASAYASATIYWCFEKTAVGVTVMEIDGWDDLRVTSVDVRWAGYASVLAEVAKDYDEDEFKGNPEINLEDDVDTNDTDEKNESVTYEPNLPSQVLLSYNGKSTTIFGKKASDILNELGFVEGEDYEGGNYSGKAVYTSCYYTPSNSYSLALDEKIYDEELKLWGIRLDYVIGVNVPEISLMGVKQGDTPDDFYKIFGTCDNISEIEADNEYYYHYEVTIEGVTMQVTICTDEDNDKRQERVKYIRLDEMKYN